MTLFFISSHVASSCHATALQQGSRRARVARAREGIAYLAVEVCGYPDPAVTAPLGGPFLRSLPGRAARQGHEHPVGSGATGANSQRACKEYSEATHTSLITTQRGSMSPFIQWLKQGLLDALRYEAGGLRRPVTLSEVLVILVLVLLSSAVAFLIYLSVLLLPTLFRG